MLDPVAQQVLNSLALHYQIAPEELIDLLLSREIGVLHTLTDPHGQGDPEELRAVLGKRDARLASLVSDLTSKVADVSEQVARAKTMLATMEHFRALLFQMERSATGARESLPPQAQGGT